MVKNPPATAGDTRNVGLVRFLGGRNGDSLQYSCLENSIARGAWWATIQVVKSRTGLSEHTGSK